MEKTQLEKLIVDGLSSHAIAKEMGNGQSTIMYWLRKYGLKTAKSSGSMFSRLDPKSVKLAIANSQTKVDVLRKLGLRESGGNFTHLARFIESESVNLDHLLGKSLPNVNQAHVPDSEVFRLDSTFARSHLRGRFIKTGVKEICVLCGVEEVWNGKKLTLHIDHINGNPTDNRLSNLRMLCPNCHSQTETYCIGSLQR